MKIGKYIGEKDVTQSHDHVNDPIHMSLLYIEQWGGHAGAHHKDWVLDQLFRILCGAPVTVTEALWDNGHTELRYSVGTSENYEARVADIENDGYEYSIGIPP